VGGVLEKMEMSAAVVCGVWPEAAGCYGPEDAGPVALRDGGRLV